MKDVFARLQKAVWVVLITACLGLVASPAGAVSSQDRKTADALYQMALKHNKTGAFIKAAIAFESAYRLDPAPTLLYNAARSYHKAGQLKEAVALYRKYLGLKGVSAKERQAVIEQLERIDKKRETPANQPAAAPKKPSTTPSKAPLVTRPGPKSLALSQKTSPLRTWGWAALGTGSALLIVSAICKGLASSDRNDFEARSQNNQGHVWGLSQYEAYEIRDRANRLDTAALTTLLIGGAIAITGAVLVTRPTPKARVEVSVGEQGIHLFAKGRF